MNTVVSLLLVAMPSVGPDAVVVCPNEFRPAMQGWVEHRERQGYEIEFVSNLKSPNAIREEIKQHNADGDLRFVILVGDDDARAARDLATRKVSVGSFRQAAVVNVHWGSEPEIATDNPYADLDDDGIPDIAIGRLPADNVDELRRICDKIIQYETRPAAGPWRRKIHIVAGVGGFGLVADATLEMVTKRLITSGIPSSYDTSMTYASWRSPFCPDPRLFRDHTIEQLNQDSLFWVYIGHGQRTYLDYVRVPGKAYPILSTHDLRRLKNQGSPPIAIFLACYTGAFDGPVDCLAEELVCHSHGPVAAVSGSRVTMPYSMSVFSSAMMDEYFVNERKTIGEVILHGKRALVEPPQGRAKFRRRLLDVLAKTISPKPELMDEERREHLALFNLLGDPMLRLPSPQPVEIGLASKQVTAGELMELSVNAPFPGQCRVELMCRRDRSKQITPPRAKFINTDDELDQYTEAHREANDRIWNTHVLDVLEMDALNTTGRVVVPPEARGPAHIRVYMDGPENRFAIGAVDVTIVEPPPEE